MKLSHGYNEYLVGFVVTDEATDRHVNFQFDENSYNWEYGCVGDSSFEVFTNEELNIITFYIQQQNDAIQARDYIAAIYDHHEVADEFKTRMAEVSCFSFSDLEEFFENTKCVWVVVNNGTITYPFYTLKSEAQKSLSDLDEEDLTFIEVFRMTEDYANTIDTIHSFVNDREERKIILDLIDAPMHSESKEFVTYQLARVLENDMGNRYFRELLAAVYSYDVFHGDIETFISLKRKTFEEFVIQETNEMLEIVFGKKVDISSIVGI